MSSNIKLKRSAIPGKIPGIAQLDLGEFAVNTHDGRLYTKKSVNSIESIISFSGAPASESIITLNSFIGDGIATSFTINRIPRNDQHAFVTINGVSQAVDAYSISNLTLAFTEAPALNDVIEVRVLDVETSTVVLRDYQPYIYTANNETTFSGTDLNGNVLEYDPTKIEVYVNGSRLVNGLDYTATNSTTVVIAQDVSGTVEIVSLSRASFVDNPLESNNELLETVAADQVADSFNALENRTAKYLVQMSTATDFHVTEILLVHDGTTTYTSEYGTIITGISLGTFSSRILNGQVELLVTTTQINTSVKLQRLSIST